MGLGPGDIASYTNPSQYADGCAQVPAPVAARSYQLDQPDVGPRNHSTSFFNIHDQGVLPHHDSFTFDFQTLLQHQLHTLPVDYGSQFGPFELERFRLGQTASLTGEQQKNQKDYPVL